METLEGSSIELIHRRKLYAFKAGHTVILLALGIMVALPLVRVQIVCATAGMIRSAFEAPAIVAPLTGKILSSCLEDLRQVEAGDTLLRFVDHGMHLIINEYKSMIHANEQAMREISSMIRGEGPSGLSRYTPTYRKQEALLNGIRAELEDLDKESRISEALYREKVIPLREYEASSSRFRVMEARLHSQEESFNSRLEEEWIRLKRDKLKLDGEVKALRTRLDMHCLLSPCAGVLQHCPSLPSGSLLIAGTPLGHIAPSDSLLAECYVGNLHIRHIQAGQDCRIRLPACDRTRDSVLHLKISKVDPDAILLDGRPVYRVRCALENKDSLIPGMGFSASIPLYRASLLSLLLRKADSHLNPSRKQVEAKNPGR